MISRFKAVAPLYYRNAAVVFIVYDVTMRSSLTTGVRDWEQQIRRNANVSELLLVLVGNKVDNENLREADRHEAREYAKNIGALYWETSAKTGYNVHELFMMVCTKLEGGGNRNLDYVCNPTKNRERLMAVRNCQDQLVDGESRPQKPRCC